MILFSLPLFPTTSAENENEEPDHGTKSGQVPPSTPNPTQHNQYYLRMREGVQERNPIRSRDRMWCYDQPISIASSASDGVIMSECERL